MQVKNGLEDWGGKMKTKRKSRQKHVFMQLPRFGDAPLRHHIIIIKRRKK
jgi:hypothetical protein